MLMMHRLVKKGVGSDAHDAWPWAGEERDWLESSRCWTWAVSKQYWSHGVHLSERLVKLYCYGALMKSNMLLADPNKHILQS